MKLLPLTKGYYTKIDDEDFERLSKHKWITINRKKSNLFYAGRSLRINGKKIVIFLHREVIGTPPNKMFVDHKDHDGLNNQKSNLRFCTQSQNSANSIMHKANKSGYRGVHWYPRKRKYNATIKHKHIGYFNNKEDAARAYNKLAKKYFGEFAQLNVINSNK